MTNKKRKPMDLEESVLDEFAEGTPAYCHHPDCFKTQTVTLSFVLDNVAYVIYKECGHLREYIKPYKTRYKQKI